MVHPSRTTESRGIRNSRTGELDNVPQDVLQRHQSKNGHPRPPSIREQRVRSNSPHSRRASSPGEDVIKTLVGNRLVLSDDPNCLSFYPPLTKAFLRRCKLLVRAHYATRNPFITLENTTQGVGLEILAEVHVEYCQRNIALEDNQYPEFRHSMARLVSPSLTCSRTYPLRCSTALQRERELPQ